MIRKNNLSHLNVRNLLQEYDRVWPGEGCCIVLCYGMVWCSMVWYGMVWYGMVWHMVIDVMWYGMVLCGEESHGMVW